MTRRPKEPVPSDLGHDWHVEVSGFLAPVWLCRRCGAWSNLNSEHVSDALWTVVLGKQIARGSCDELLALSIMEER